MTWLIDGHNLIGVLSGSELTDPDDEWQLVLRLRSFATAQRQAFTVVFDSGAGLTPRWQLSDERLTVRFAPPGVEADALIVRLVDGAAQPGQVIVVTNDQGLAAKVRAVGGQVRSATQCAAQLTPPRSLLPAQPAAPEMRPKPRAAGFADIYEGFIEAEKDQARFADDPRASAAGWIEALYSDDTADAARAARWLGRFGRETALEPLLDALSHRTAAVRAAALLALGELGDDSALPALARSLHEDSSGMAREAAAQALGRFNSKPAAAALQAALDDPKTKVRKAASAGLERQRARSAHF